MKNLLLSLLIAGGTSIGSADIQPQKMVQIPPPPGASIKFYCCKEGLLSVRIIDGKAHLDLLPWVLLDAYRERLKPTIKI